MNDDGVLWIEDDNLYFLFRRGKSEHIKALYEKGEIYLNTIDYIRKCDQNTERSDPNDGIFKRLFLGDVKVSMCDVGRDIDKEGITLNAIDCVLTEDSVKKGNIYCLSGIFSEHLMGDREDIRFDTQSFGESLILIYNPKDFIDRIILGLKKEGYEDIVFRRVSYYQNDYSGPVGFFKKHEKFKSQSELRILIPNDNDVPIKIYIGSLSDIAYIDNNTLLKLVYTDGKEQIINLG